MSLYDYRTSLSIGSMDARPSFYGIIMAAMRQADDRNISKLAQMWPETFAEFRLRYNAPGGVLTSDPE